MADFGYFFIYSNSIGRVEKQKAYYLGFPNGSGKGCDRVIRNKKKGNLRSFIAN